MADQKYAYFTRTESGEETIFDVHPTKMGPWVPGAVAVSILVSFPLVLGLASMLHFSLLVWLWLGWAAFTVYRVGNGWLNHRPHQLHVKPDGISIIRENAVLQFFDREDIGELTIVENGIRISTLAPAPYVIGGGMEGMAMNMGAGMVNGVLDASAAIGVLVGARHLVSRTAVHIRRKSHSQAFILAAFLTRPCAEALMADVIDCIDAKPWPADAEEEAA